MAEILNQSEIDALLNDLGSEAAPSAAPASMDISTGGAAGGVALGASANKQVALYDFKRPDRVSKEQIRTMENLHDSYGRLLSTSLTTMLRTLVEIQLVSVDQLTYHEIILSISTPSCIYIFQLEPLEGSALLEVSPALSFIFLERLFGGLGKGSDDVRELTDIEKSVMNKIIERMLVDLKLVWENIGIFSPKIDSYETNPQFVQIAPPGETVIYISLEVRMKSGSGLINFCFPYILLESIIDKLSGETWIAAQKTTTQETRRIVEREIGETNVELCCKIGDLELTMRDLLQLQNGDVLVLDKPASSDLVVTIEDKPKFLAKPGTSGRKKSLQITSIIDRQAGDNDE